jgi:pilus assembly protein FimV
MMETPAAENEISFELPAEDNASLELPDLGESIEMASEEKPEPAAAAVEESPDFNFDTSFATSEQMADADETPNLQEIDLSGISLDFGPTIDNPEAVDEGFSTDADIAEGESPEVETKLDLVTAYMEMGDKEGARELLDEVLKEGGPQQKERAQQMLSNIG